VMECAGAPARMRRPTCTSSARMVNTISRRRVLAVHVDAMSNRRVCLTAIGRSVRCQRWLWLSLQRSTSVVSLLEQPKQHSCIRECHQTARYHVESRRLSAKYLLPRQTSARCCFSPSCFLSSSATGSLRLHQCWQDIVTKHLQDQTRSSSRFN
jgi:hypothetical protein